MQVAVLIPLMRPHRIAGLVQNIRETTPDCHIVVIATGECAEASRHLGVSLIEDSGGTWAQRINAGFTVTTEPYIFTGADDLLFHSGWIEAAMEVMKTLDGVLAVNDLYNTAGVHYLMARSYIDTLGGCVGEPGVVCHEGYRHSYVDDEIRATAQFHERWGGVVQNSVVEHMHPGAGKSSLDEIYAMGEASMDQGKVLFASRAHLWQK